MSIDTVNDLPPRVQYVAAAAQTAFDYPFPIFTDADLIVYVDSVLQALSTDYTVSGEGDDTGGTVTFVSALVGDEIVTIERSIAIERNTDFQQNGPFNSIRFNDELDKIFLILQQLGSKIKRALRLPTTAEVTDAETELPVANWANKYMTFDSDGVPTPAALSDETMTQATIGTLLFPQTPAEISAGVTPVNYAYEPGDVRRYGMIGDGATDNAVAFQNALDANAGSVEVRVPAASGNYQIGSQINVPSKTRLRLDIGAILEMTLDDTPLLEGLGVTDITISGGEILGVQGTVDWPSPLTNSEGLVHFNVDGATQCERIRIKNVHIHRTWTPISCIKVKKLWVQTCECHDYLRYGILASQSVDFHIDHNTVYDSNLATAANAYGIMATGANAGGFVLERCSISFNKIYDIPAWDGIMSHDCTKLIVAFNQIDNVRLGIDIGLSTAANVIEDVLILGNQVRLTTTDTWGGTAANHAGIHVVGLSGQQVKRAIIANNIVTGYNAMTGATFSGDPAPINAEYVDSLTITGNVIEDVQSVVGDSPGIFLVGTLGAISVCGNSLEGDMTAGAIRLATVTADALAIVGNTIIVDTAAEEAVQITGSTIGKLSLGHNVTNSTTPLTITTSTVVYEGEGSFTGTLTGCTTSPTGSVEYSINYEDRTVTLEIPAITGTSNTTAATLTGMPALIRPSETQFGLIVTQDNGTEAISRCSIATDGVIALYNGVSLTFTNSGVKGVSAGTVKYRLL